MTNKGFKEGMEVTFEHNKTKYNDGGKLYCDTDGKGYVCNGNMLSSNGGTRIGIENVTNLQPKFRTIDDLVEYKNCEVIGNFMENPDLLNK